jgi:hypothetical protein
MNTQTMTTDAAERYAFTVAATHHETGDVRAAALAGRRTLRIYFG